MADRLLVLVTGYAGSGKTETGKLLAQATGWALVDKDTITRPMTERLLEQLHGDPHDRQTQLYLTQVRPLEYECLMRTGWENIECGTSTILSAPFLREVCDVGWVTAVQRRCDYLGTALRIIWVDSDGESMRERLIARNAERDAWKLSNWREYVTGIDLALRPCTEHLLVDNRIDTGEPLLHQVLRLAETLSGDTAPVT